MLKIPHYYSQWNQDKYLNDTIFQGKKGFFVDVGAHDGVRFSNTLFFEEHLLWEGICIEPNPEVYNVLKNNRKSLCLHGCAYDKNGEIDFTTISGYSEMLSGISESYSDEHKNRIEKEIEIKGGDKKEIKVPCFTLASIFEKYDVKDIDYLSIDTEGSELKVLQGIDFSKVKIKVIEVETNYEEDKIKIRDFLLSKNYEFLTRIGGDDVYLKTE